MIQENLKKNLINQYGVEITNQVFEGYNSSRVVSLRINSIKTTTITIGTTASPANNKLKFFIF